MNARMTSLAAAVSLSLAACAPDTHGDLRNLVEVHPAGAAARLTFAGIGVGSPRGDAAATFDDGFAPRRLVADFGTALDVLVAAGDGGVENMALMYTGNPIAVRSVFRRWKEVFARAGAECDEGACFWTEDGAMVATLTTHDRWRVPREVHVTINR